MILRDLSHHTNIRTSHNPTIFIPLSMTMDFLAFNIWWLSIKSIPKLYQRPFTSQISWLHITHTILFLWRQFVCLFFLWQFVCPVSMTTVCLPCFYDDGLSALFLWRQFVCPVSMMTVCLPCFYDDGLSALCFMYSDVWYFWFSNTLACSNSCSFYNSKDISNHYTQNY